MEYIQNIASTFNIYNVLVERSAFLYCFINLVANLYLSTEYEEVFDGVFDL